MDGRHLPTLLAATGTASWECHFALEQLRMFYELVWPLECGIKSECQVGVRRQVADGKTEAETTVRGQEQHVGTKFLGGGWKTSAG